MGMVEFDFPAAGKYTADVLVIGAGPAGVCAAISAAREGAKVLLVEQNGFSGGMATAGLVGPFMTCYDKSGNTMIIRGIFSEIVDRLVDCGGAIHPLLVRSGTAYTSWIKDGHDHCTPFDAEKLKKLLDDMLVEAAVKVLYHTVFIAPVMDGRSFKGAVIAEKGGIKTIESAVIIDATGDGDVAARGGVAFEKGNSRLNIVQPASMFFRICNVESRALEKDVEQHRDKFYRKDGINYRSFHWYVTEAREAGDWNLDRTSIGLYRGVAEDEWCVNVSRVMCVDSTDSESLTAGEIEGRRQVEQIMNFIKKYLPGCSSAKLMASGSTLGIRESRHIVGRYIMTLDDVIYGRVPEDAIVLCSNSVDIHGRFGPKSNEYITVKSGNYYGIPYRCLLPKDAEGLLMAGRCISADSEAAGAVRVMPPCMAMGQAAGTAAAIAAAQGKEPGSIDVQELRRRLIANGAYL